MERELLHFSSLLSWVTRASNWTYVRWNKREMIKIANICWIPAICHYSLGTCINYFCNRVYEIGITKAQRGFITCPWSHSSSMAKLGFEPRPAGQGGHCFALQETACLKCHPFIQPSVFCQQVFTGYLPRTRHRLWGCWSTQHST